jgi:hypothetical protein
MAEEKRQRGEQRCDEDRRRVHDLGYFESEDNERRSFKERRSDSERRSGWVRVGRWVSVFARALGYRK